MGYLSSRRKWLAYVLIVCLIGSSFPYGPAEAADAEPLAVFTADFEDNRLDGWDIYGSDNAGNRGIWSTNGNDVPNVDGNRWTWFKDSDRKLFVSGSPGSKAIAKETYFTNLIYEADLQIGGLPGSDDGSGLLFRATDFSDNQADGYRGYFAALRLNGTIQLGKVDGGKWHELSVVPTPWNKGRMKIVAVEDHIQIYLNNQLFVDYTDHDNPILAGGAIGLRTWWGTSSIDNIRVREYSAAAPSAPGFSLAGGVYNEPKAIALTAESGAVIRYTTDGSEPDSASSIYHEPINVDSTMLLKAYAELPGQMVSDIADELYIVAEAKEELREEFDGGDGSGWTVYQGLNLDSKWSVRDGQFVAERPRGDRALPEGEYTDFILEAKVHLGNSNQSSGLFFRGSENGIGADKANGYFAGINKKGYIEVGKLNAGGENGSWKDLAREVAVVYADRENDLKMIALGSTFYFYVNGGLALVFQDEDYSSGMAGLRAWNDDGTVAYDNVVIRSLAPIEEPVQPAEDFIETFDDGNAEGWTTYGGIWNVEDGAYKVNKGAGFKAVADETQFENFTYEVDIKLTDAINNDNAGIIFRVNNPSVGGDNMEGYYAGLTISGRVQLGKMNYNWTELASIPYPVQLNKVYRMKVVANGPNIDIYVDDNHVVSAVDRSFAKGSIGLRSHWAIAYYDNIKVSDTGKAILPDYDWSWVKGAVFAPTNAVNQIQHWLEYDPEINDRELSYAKTYGLNFVRVYLHNLLWENDSESLLGHLEDFLTRADKYGLKTELVFFDDCWNPEPVYGPQEAPKYGVHNSRWVQAPGASFKQNYAANKQKLKEYVQGIVSAYANDDRIAFWNIYNEPGNGQSGLYSDVTKQIMNDARIWIKETGSKHPVSSTGGQFSGDATSDFITYHPYGADYDTRYGVRKDVLADEVMNRGDQTVAGVVANFGGKGIGYVIWELGIGRTNTRFPWGTDVNPASSEPEVPFHGLVYPDGHPWSLNDVKALTGVDFYTLPVYQVHYYRDPEFKALAKSSITPRIDFDLGNEKGTGSPDASAGIGEDHFSIRWTGTVHAPAAGEYILYADSDNIARIWVGETLVVDKTSAVREEASGQIELDGDENYPVTIEYVHAEGDASMHVRWSGPSLAKQALLPVYSEINVESVKLNAEVLQLKTHETHKLIAEITPANASNQQIAWSSSERGVATVDENGVIKALNPGKAIITATTADGGKQASVEVTVKAGTTFSNPIVPVSGNAGSADPSIVYKDGYYYYVKSVKDTSIIVAKSKRLQDIGTAPRVTVYTPPAGQKYSKELWAPELQFIQGKWYIYVAADDGDNANHRMYVLESKTDDAQGEYIFKGKISDSTDRWSIDGAVLEKEDGSLFFVWSGWEGAVNERQNLYIAPMSNPWTISGPRVMVSTPDEKWELNGVPYINEGPQPIVRNGKYYIVYSGSGSWSDDYALGMLMNTDGDLLNPKSWKKVGPLFTKVNTAYGPGHNSFTKSPDGTEDWLIYHADLVSGGSWGNRSVRAQKFTWNEDGTPNFGTPVAYGEWIEQPSGTPDIIRAEYEAEDAELGGTAKINASGNASGGKVVGHLDTAGSDYVQFHVYAEEAGDYTLAVMAANGSAGGAVATHDVIVNETDSYTMEYENFGWNHYNPSSISVNLNQGGNIVRLTTRTNFVEVDRLIIERLENDGNHPIESIRLNSSELKLVTGASAEVRATLSPISSVNDELVITSSDASIASGVVSGVNQALGQAAVKINAHKEGNVVIRIASAKDPSIAAELSVTVRGLPNEPDLSAFAVDQFNSDKLEDGWSIFQENASNWSLTQNPGYLTIHTTSTDVFQDNNSQENVFLQKVPDGSDFEVIVKLDAAISQNHQQAGLFVWQDADNFVKLGHVYANGLTIESAYEINRVYQKPNNFIAHPGGNTHTLKIKKLGNVYTTYVWDGYEWLKAADPITAQLKDIKVGFYANNIVSSQRIYAKFDYFAVRVMEGGVELDQHQLDLQAGETAKLTNKGISGENVKWTSSNPAIASVDSSGKVTAHAPGRAVIRATTEMGDYSDEAIVTVRDNEAQPDYWYKENFDSGSAAGWTTFGGTWSVSSDGRYRVSSGQGFKALYNELEFTDYVYEADVKIHSGSEAGLIFRVSDAAVGADAMSGYYIGLNAEKQYAVLGEFTNGRWTEIATKNMPIRHNQAYPVKIAVSKGHVQVYINDNELNTNPYPKFDIDYTAHWTTGKIGFRTWNAEASIDNVKLSPFDDTIVGETYTNSVMPGIADPHVLYYDGVYYLYGTHTADHPNMINGIKVYTSTDLANWTEHPGWALHRDNSWGENRFWAPEVIEKDGKFYMYYAVEERLAVATSDSPLGPFVQEVKAPLHKEIGEIDAHVFTDDDGKKYLYFVRFNNGNVLYVAELNEDMMSIKEDTITFVMRPTQDWEKSQKPPVYDVNEGPFVVKHNGTYYMTYSGNHFQSPDYGVGYATADSPMGPWTKYEYNPIMKSNLIVPGAGHHSLVYSPDGTELFMVYHTHNSTTATEPRKLAIDRVQFVPNPNGGPDVMEVWGPTVTPQLLPSHKEVQPEPKGEAVLSGAASVTSGATTELVYSLRGMEASAFKQLLAQQLAVSYDPSRLQFVKAESLKGDKLEVITSTEGSEQGKVLIVAVSKGDGFDANGEWLKLSFRAKGGAVAQTTVKLSQIVVANREGEELAIEDASHSFGITSGGSGTVIWPDNPPIVKPTEDSELEPINDKRVLNAPVGGGLATVKAAGGAYKVTLKKNSATGAEEPMVLTLPYTKGMKEQLLGLYRYDSDSGQWLYVGGKADSKTKNISATISESGIYAVFEYTKMFTDVPAGHWAENALQILAAKRIVNGINDAQFSPNGKTTRAEFTALLVRALGLPMAEQPLTFQDVSGDQWFAKEVAAAYHAGLVQGLSTDRFAPNAEITREQMAILLVRAYEYKTGQAIAGHDEAAEFRDSGSISAWAREGLSKALAAKLIQGKGEGRLDPEADATRAQTAQAIFNLYQMIIDVE